MKSANAIIAISDERSDRRHLTVMMVGKVRGNRGEFPCVVKDVSQRGLKARFPYPQVVGERLEISLRDRPARGATVRWVDGMHAGVEFDAPIDVKTLIENEAVDRPYRAPRFDCGQLATLMLAEGCRSIELIDVSLGGAKLGITEEFPVQPPGRWATLILPGSDPRSGTICWSRGGRLGFRFAAALPLDVLAALLATSDH